MRDFNAALLMSVDEGLKAVLGEPGCCALYFHLEKKHSVKKEEIPLKLEDFAAALESIFGMGALTLEKVIEKQLYSKLGYPSEEMEIPGNFAGKVNVARRAATSRKPKGRRRGMSVRKE